MPENVISGADAGRNVFPGKQVGAGEFRGRPKLAGRFVLIRIIRVEAVKTHPIVNRQFAQAPAVHGEKSQRIYLIYRRDRPVVSHNLLWNAALELQQVIAAGLFKQNLGVAFFEIQFRAELELVFPGDVAHAPFRFIAVLRAIGSLSVKCVWAGKEAGGELLAGGVSL